MNNFETNINLNPQDIANMVSHIKVPEGSALLGVLPILAIIFGSDNVSLIIRQIKVLSTESVKTLVLKVRDTIVEPRYPLERSVWQFNDPQADLSMFSAALENSDSLARKEFIKYMSLYEDVFPFVCTYFEELDPSTVMEFRPDAHPLEPRDTRRNPPDPTDHEMGPAAIIVPSIAVGSLLLLSSKLKSIPGETK